MVSTITPSAVSFAGVRSFALPAVSVATVGVRAGVAGGVSAPALSWSNGSVCIADMGGASVESMAPKTAPKTAHVSAYATRQRLAKKASHPRGRLR